MNAAPPNDPQAVRDQRAATASSPRPDGHASPYVELDRAQWSRLRASTPLTLSAEELEPLRGLGDRIDLTEVTEVYLPLTRLLNLYVGATDELRGALRTFLGPGASREVDGHQPPGSGDRTPFVIGIAGSVAVGKSTTARILAALLARWPGHPRVDLVTTDGFLYPNEELARRGLMQRKGFPESYDQRALLRFVAAVKSGRRRVSAPVYSHLTYDIVLGERQIVDQPDILLVEGLNVLQPPAPLPDGRPRMAVSDFFDFSLYVDARTEDIRAWYIERFLSLRETAFRDPASYFRRLTLLTEEEAIGFAQEIWRDVNELNLLENIRPTRSRATLVLQKDRDHGVRRVRLRKL